MSWAVTIYTRANTQYTYTALTAMHRMAQPYIYTDISLIL